MDRITNRIINRFNHAVRNITDTEAGVESGLNSQTISNLRNKKLKFLRNSTRQKLNDFLARGTNTPIQRRDISDIKREYALATTSKLTINGVDYFTKEGVIEILNKGL